MVYSQYYNWVDFYYLNNFFWLEYTINWDFFNNIFFFDIFFFDIIFNLGYNSIKILVNPILNISYIDLILLTIVNNYENSFILYNSFFLDLINILDVFFININFYYYLEYRNYLLLFFYYNPELVLSINTYFNTYFNNYFNNNIFIIYKFFNNKFDIFLLDYINYFKTTIMTFIIIFIFFDIFNILKINKNLSFFFTKFFLYIYSISNELRFQFELFINFILFTLLYFIFMLISYNDNQIDYIEMLNLSIFLFFIYIILFFLIKYSVHYFSFLESSIINGKSTLFILQQFVKDISNTFALFLRFFLLFFRLNIYDGLDDILDSYYIFFCDFDNDSYYDEIMLPIDSILFILVDNNLDSNFINTAEADNLNDFFQKYYLIWGKFFMFWAFILEIIFRLSLAIYIMYLIIFEIHSINNSFYEDNYFFFKKNKICL